MILTGKELDADEAVRSGFATALHPSDELWQGALGMARRIAEMNPAGVRLALAHLRQAGEVGRDGFQGR